MYDEYYGLAFRPFQVTPDPLSYFESSTHSKALSYLGYGLAQGEGIIIITGDIGAGKSTLVSHLMQTIDRTRMAAATIVTSQLDTHDLVKMAAESFGIDTRGLDKASSLRAIQVFLHAAARTDKRCLLVVDEAHNLSIEALEELRMLSDFKLGSTSLLQIFLLGQPEFRDLIMDAPELEKFRHRVIATHHLTPMDKNEVEPYIMHRLARAGWYGRPSFAPQVFQILFAETGGVPRKLNTLMNRVMLMGAVENLNSIDPPTVRAVIADMACRPFAYDAQMSEETAAFGANLLDEVRPEDYVLHDSGPDEAALFVEKLVERTTAGQEEESGKFKPYMSPAPAEPLDADMLPTTLDNPTEHSAKSKIDGLNTRLKALENRVSEQDANLRRVVATVLDWMNKEGSLEVPLQPNNRAA